MTKRTKERLFLAIIADLILAVLLLFVKGHHDCVDADCLICSLVGYGFIIVAVIAMLLVLFPIFYILTIKLLGFFLHEDAEDSISFEPTTFPSVINNNSLVKSFVKIQ